ncbi:MAG: dihydroorotase [Clostridiales bacterium]|jgi:dihydroorotase|nr:dihydroorotase [Clostridiales bacterium]
MGTILIKNGSLVRDGVRVADILIKDDYISRIGRIDRGADETVDAEGKYVFYGFCDMHTHLREPGFTHKETVKTGAAAAAKGGFTDIFCMPNTNPVCDSEVVAEFINRRAEQAGYVRVHPVGAITKGLKGAELSAMAGLKTAGVLAVSDDGCPVSDGAVMRRGMEYADGLGLLVLSHSEDKSLSAGGVVNEGANSVAAGLPGISRAAEEAGIARDLILAETLGIRIHICHVSTRGGVELVRYFKRKGVAVTAETCPHYFALNDACILDYNTAAKVNPPIRTEDDRKAVIEGIADGAIDVIATDHAPHSAGEKAADFVGAPFGISGLETAFSLSYTILVQSGIIDIVKLGDLLSAAPRRITGLGGRLREGERADITVIDPDLSWRIDAQRLVSMGKNTPFDGVKAHGMVTETIVSGRRLVREGRLVRPC